MVDYRDDWKYSKPIPRVEADKRYRDNWDRVFGQKAMSEIDEHGEKCIAMYTKDSNE